MTRSQDMHNVLITGASAGIGEALARQFARAGCDLILVARSADKLAQLAQQLEDDYDIRARVEPADLAKRAGAKNLAATLSKQDVEVDILVNNAGVMEHGAFASMPVSAHRRVVDLNISGLTSMLNHFLPAMVERGSGRILNVASVAAFQPLPGLATYAASKAYVLSLTEALAEELSGTGVTITALCPGFTATKMLRDAQEGNDALSAIPQIMVSDVDDVAKQGYAACLAGEVICVPGMLNLATTITGRALPRWLVRRVSGIFGRLTTR